MRVTLCLWRYAEYLVGSRRWVSFVFENAVRGNGACRVRANKVEFVDMQFNDATRPIDKMMCTNATEAL